MREALSGLVDVWYSLPDAPLPAVSSVDLGGNPLRPSFIRIPSPTRDLLQQGDLPRVLSTETLRHWIERQGEISNALGRTLNPPILQGRFLLASPDRFIAGTMALRGTAMELTEADLTRCLALMQHDNTLYGKRSERTLQALQAYLLTLDDPQGPSPKVVATLKDELNKLLGRADRNRGAAHLAHSLFPANQGARIAVFVQLASLAAGLGVFAFFMSGSLLSEGDKNNVG
ncbi:MAG: hypothetical protein HYW02_02245 [Deltaproteobacteria bacterium]|nr:hypothetical protein [Deltaproteobacteria bacterium]